MRGFVAAAVLAGAMVAASPALATNTFKYFDAQKYEWDTQPTQMTNHGQVAPGATVTFAANVAETFANHPLVWDTGEFPTESGAVSNKSYTAPTQPGFYAFHCSVHGTGGTEGSPGSGMAGYLVVGTDGHATADFSAPSPATPGQAATFTYTGTGDPDAGDAITRYLWDLDGDGSFETSTTTGTATKTYAQPGTVNVSLKVIDRGHEFSAVATHAVDVRSPGGSAVVDRIAPTAAITAARIKKGKLRITFTSSETGSAAAVLKRGKRKLGSGRTSFTVVGKHTLVVKLNRSGRKALKRRKRARIRLTVADLAGNKTVKSRSLKLQR